MNVQFKIYKRTLFLIVCIVLWYLSLLDIIPYAGLIDDFIPAIFGMIWIKSLLGKKQFSDEHIVFYILIIILIIGLFSNVYAGLVLNIKMIVIDLFSYTKIFFVYLGTSVLLENHKNAQRQLVKYIGKFAKIYLIISFIFGILNLFGIVNMTQQVRFGINSFSFIYSNPSQYGILVAVALGFILIDGGKQHIRLYEFIGMSVLLMTMKGMSLIIFAVYVVMSFLRTRKIRIWQIVLVTAVLLLVLRYQIYTYLLDSSAPRAMLLKYGFVTANSYFPFGSGFGTYGSDIAGKYYSSLYIKYGFTNRLSLLYGKETALNDAYLAMLLGQFGYIATILHYAIFVVIGKRILNTKRYNYKAFYITVAFFICIQGLSIMAGSLKGTIGQLMMMAIQLYCINNKGDK